MVCHLQLHGHLLTLIPAEAVDNAALHTPMLVEVACNPLIQFFDCLLKLCLLLADLVSVTGMPPSNNYTAQNRSQQVFMLTLEQKT